MSRVAVVGCGYWGPNLIRVLSMLPECTLEAVCDQDEKRLEQVARRFPAVRTTPDVRTLLADPAIDALVIATPASTHHSLVRAALEAGKHVLVEKPFTTSLASAKELVDLARRRDLVLQVDFPFVYDTAVQKIRSLIAGGELGRVLYIDSVRVNLGLFQSDVSVLWDLVSHDVSILLYLLATMPSWVSATGVAHYGELAEVAYVTMMFEQNCIAHVHVNWLAPVKVRSMLIGGAQRMVVYDDLEPSTKLRIYEKGVTLGKVGGVERRRALVDYRMGDMCAPYLAKTEPLELVCRDFLAAISQRRPPLTDGEMGLRVVQVLAAAEQSIARGGARISL